MEKHEHVKTKQHATKKIHGTMMKSKKKSENILIQVKMETKSVGNSKEVLTGKFTGIQAYLKQQEKSQVNN